jgi:hypothetical protein
VIATGVWVAVPVDSSQRAWIAFFVLGTVLPAAIAIVLAVGSRTSAGAARALGWLALMMSSLTVVVGAVYGLTYRTPIVGAVIQVLALLAVMRFRRESRVDALLWLVVGLGTWGVGASLIWWVSPDAFLQNTWSVGVFVVATAVVLGALWLPDAIAGRWLRLVGFGLTLIPLALASVWTNDLFDITTTYHWEVYIGPADLIRQGGWLLWDVPSQYGFLSELAIAWIPTPSPWEGLFILNSVANFLLAMTVFLLLRSLGRGVLNLLMSFSVALAACFLRPGFANQFIGPDGYPSTGGFRFIWCVALLLVFVALLRTSSPRGRLTLLVAGNLLWILGVLWSAESAIYSTFVWLPGYALTVLADHWGQREQPDWMTRIARLLALPVIFLATAVAIVFIVYRLGLGHGPDLQSFYEYGLTYQAGFGSYPLDPGGPGWALFVAYVATLVTLAWKVRKQPATASVVLLATAAMIFATSSYFVGRSHPNNVWNLAPEVCIALAITLLLAGRDLRSDPVPVLLRLACAPIFIVLLTGTFGEQAALVDYVARPQLPLNRIDAALPPTDPTLLTLLDAHVHAGDRMVYVCGTADHVDPLLTTHLSANTEQPDGAPLWLPLVPYSGVNHLAPARRVTYLERFIERHPEGGWLIECIGAESPWVTQTVQDNFTMGPSYANADYRVTLWLPDSGAE